RREARHVEPLGLGHVRRAHQVFDALPDHVEAPLEGVLVLRVLAGAHEDLADGGHHALRDLAGRLLVHGHAPPAEDLLALLTDHLLDDALALVPLVHLVRQEDHADAVLAGGGEIDAERLRLAAEERVRDLDEDAGAVAGVRIAAARAPVRQVLEDREPLLHDVVRALALHVHDEADAACVVLDLRVLQPAGPSLCHDYALRKCPLLSPEAPDDRRARRVWLGGTVSSWFCLSPSCTRSTWVDSTTVVSVRATPSIDRICAIRRSSVDVLAVFTLRSRVKAPVTWWHSSTSASAAICRSN